VGIALLATFVVVPRPIEPDAMPLPLVDRIEERRARTEDDARADDAVNRPLSYDVRAIGELVRRYGARTAVKRDAEGELVALRTAVPIASRGRGSEALIRLRAIQTRLFLRALSTWETTGVESQDLKELGGDFVVRATDNGWIDASRRVLASPDERAVLFRLRWTELTELGALAPFRPSLNEWRIYYRFLIQHPELGAKGDGSADARRRLGYVEALAHRDSEYLSDLARGVLYFRLGDYSAAAGALESHLTAHPDGVWSLRARNYLACALERVAASDGE
jgi:hypothetical protein